MKVAIYARYSSDNQRDASIADQLRVCRAFAERQGWTIQQEYSDHAMSGATLLRSGFQALMRDALNRRFDVVLAESLDRFSRDQEDTAGLFKRLTFAGVDIVTLAEGDITHLHIGFKGTMNALFLKDLAEKTHRGLRGRIEDGKSAGGLCYGYRVVRTLSAGTVTTGEREIEPAEATVVERIFGEFIAGVSPKQITENLNRAGIAGPFGGGWSPSTIYGNGKRGTGILNNELYIGRLVWSRLRYVKNPDTGKRVSRLNPASEWMRKEVPALRIVSDEMWSDAKQRQEHGRHAVRIAGNPGGARRPQELFNEFCREFTREMNRLRMERRASLSSAKREVERISTRIKKLLNLMLDDEIAVDEGKAEIKALDARRKELQAQLESADEPLPLLHAEMAELYR
jgi:DNA invertase Pin-like site-specific DNA recombinase